MNNNPFIPHPPLPLGQRQPQPAQPDHSAFCTVPQHLQRFHFQAPTAPVHNSQRTVSHPSRPPQPEQSAFYTNYDYGPQWCGQQHHYQQPQYHISPPLAQPPPQPAAQQNYNSHQPTAGYPLHHVPQPSAPPQPQAAYYPHLQPQHQQQQQQRLHHTPPPQDLRPAKRQRFNSPNCNRQVHDHGPLAPQPQFQLPPFPAQTPEVYPSQSEGSRREDGRGTTGGAMSEIADRGWGDLYMDSSGGEGRRASQSGGGVHAHLLGGNYGGAASMQDEGCNPFPDSVEQAAVPVATIFQGAHGFSINGNPWFANISTVYNSGRIHGLENLKEFVSFAALHDSAQQDPDRRCHPGTRETVLTQLRGWFDNPNATDRIIWLHGPAGAGKSAIAQTIADEYKKRGVAATFFFYRSDHSRNDGNRLFPTIAWQLAFSIPPTKDFIVHALDETPHLPTQAIEPQFEQLVVRPFQPTNNITSQMSHPAPIIIIDGVDECSVEDLQRRFLTVIGDATKNHRVPLRFLIVSRPEAVIEETVNKFKDFTVSIDLAKLDDSHRDIQKYLTDKFFEIASNRGLDRTWPDQEIIKEIVFKSSGNFIFASVVIRFISDEDYEPEILLNIVRNLAPRGNMSPFAILDELFLEILKQQRDQDFLKTFLALLVGRISTQSRYSLYKDDAMLMNVSEKGLCVKLRRMRSLLKFEPFIHVYHKSFLDFLRDPSRSGQYHVSKHSGQRRYLELIVDSVVRHISMAIEQPNCHGTCHSSPKFKSIVHDYPPNITLSVEDWQEVLKPLLDLQDKLLKTSRPQSCHVTQVMRHLLLHLVFLQGKSHHITAVQTLESNMKTVTEWSPALVTETQQNIPEQDLDGCLSGLLSRLQKWIRWAIIDCMFSLLAFDYAEIVARVRTIPDAQKLIDLIDLLINNKSFFSQCSQDAACNAARLASDIFARVPHLPQSLFLNKLGYRSEPPMSTFFEFDCQSAFISRILDHNFIVLVSGIRDGKYGLEFVRSNENISVKEWLSSSPNPNLVTRIRVILEVARTIQYIHSMGVGLYSRYINSSHFFLNSDLRAQFEFYGLFAWSVRKALVDWRGHSVLLTSCTYESNINAFGHLFHAVCSPYENLSNRLVEDAMDLIKQCHAKDRKSRPTMEDVVTKMETWDLTETACSH